MQFDDRVGISGCWVKCVVKLHRYITARTHMPSIPTYAWVLNKMFALAWAVEIIILRWSVRLGKLLLIIVSRLTDFHWTRRSTSLATTIMLFKACCDTCSSASCVSRCCCLASCNPKNSFLCDACKLFIDSFWSWIVFASWRFTSICDAKVSLRRLIWSICNALNGIDGVSGVPKKLFALFFVLIIAAQEQLRLNVNALKMQTTMSKRVAILAKQINNNNKNDDATFPFGTAPRI